MTDDTRDLRSALTRREFLHLAGASLALAGLDGCSRMPAEHILPYVDNRPEVTPGVASYYATAMSLDGFATGVIVESHGGRPTKIEGNPEHPASLGATGALEQASVLQLYDPDRAKSARVGSSPTVWTQMATMLAPEVLRRRVGARGNGLHMLIERSSSPLDEQLLTRVLGAHPDARVYMYSPLAAAPSTRTVRHYDIASADVILAVDSDFLASGPFHLRYARQFADNRRLAQPGDRMNRLYVIESSFTPTGTAADHRLAVPPRDIDAALRVLRSALSNDVPRPGTPSTTWLAAVARDLREHAGRALVILGDGHTDDAIRLVDEINAAIGARDRLTWIASSPIIGQQVPVHSLADLVEALRSRVVDTLIIAGGNPLYASPAVMGLASLVRTVPNVGYLGMYENETARDARWFIPMSHYLESWGDTRAYDGTLSIVQPLVNPLYASISPAELYAVLAGVPVDGSHGYTAMRASWNQQRGAGADDAWADALQRGVVPGTAFSRTTPAPPQALTPELAGSPMTTPEPWAVDVLYVADPKVHDGSFANNGWLQELPAPLTQLTWGNAGSMSPATARRLGVAAGDVVELSSSGRKLDVPVVIVPGHADDTVSVSFGYGRAGAESLAQGVGSNAYTMWPALGARSEFGVTVAATGRKQALALAQTTMTSPVGNPVRHATLAAYRAAPDKVSPRPPRALSLYPATTPAPGPQWAMTIDLTTCVGCGACVVACQAENNIPVVGAGEVRNGRAMQWLRIDRYFAEQEADVEALLQPMLCQHCEKAPCEYVCPVEATVHSADGLNEMVYNRCVGTRFCSNNCPYKVRHFNWFDYNAHLSETELMVKNPNVTVRERGVMEKCTFCVQRIREAEIAAGRENRALRPDEVRTACQQACPTNAIVFGSLTDDESEMARRRRQPRAFAALEELGTEPRVRYLARIRNVNDAISPER